jgi:hypothetical protein
MRNVAASGPSVGVQVGSRTIDAWLPSMARGKSPRRSARRLPSASPG